MNAWSARTLTPGAMMCAPIRYTRIAMSVNVSFRLSSSSIPRLGTCTFGVVTLRLDGTAGRLDLGLGRRGHGDSPDRECPRRVARAKEFNRGAGLLDQARARQRVRRHLTALELLELAEIDHLGHDLERVREPALGQPPV